MAIAATSASWFLEWEAPAGFERYIERLGRSPLRDGLAEPSMPDIPALATAAEEFAMQIVGPPMSMDSATRD